MRRVLTAGHGRTGAVRALALLGVAAALAGCNHDREVVAAAYPTDLRHRHPITISEGVRTVELFVGTSRGSLTPKQRADVAGFAHTWGHESTGGIVIDVPSATSNGHAASDVLPEIRSILAANGVPPDVIAARPYRPVDPMKLATVRLKYPRMVAQAGPCGMWPRDIGPSWNARDEQNWPYWNLGCSQQRNLAAMIDDPSDLVQPRSETGIDAQRRSTVLDKYRKGEATATVYPDANKGKISEVGQ
jgi:pilus assembly protein CpaD